MGSDSPNLIERSDDHPKTESGILSFCFDYIFK